MTQLKIAINKDIETVWEYISNIESHQNWMQDAKNVELISGVPNAVGAKYVCDTMVGPLRTKDTFELLAYKKPDYMEIYHFGAVSGSGYFRLKKLTQNCTEFIWEEELKFPLYMGGIAGKKIAMFLLHNIWRKNLRNLKEAIEK